MAFLDNAYHLFFMLKEGTFALQHGRFGTAFTQLFPLAGARLGLPLPLTTALYSASFVVPPAIVFTLLAGPLQNGRLALAYLLCIVVMQTHVFFWPLSELHQGIAFLMLLGGIVEAQLHF